MDYTLKVGQRFIVPSAVCREYEKLLGREFCFTVEIHSLEERRWASYLEPTGDMFLTSVEWKTPNRESYYYIYYCLALGHDKYGDPALNYSPDIVAGEGTWYVPNLTRWQSWFLYLWFNDVVTLVS